MVTRTSQRHAQRRPEAHLLALRAEDSGGHGAQLAVPPQVGQLLGDQNEVDVPVILCLQGPAQQHPACTDRESGVVQIEGGQGLMLACAGMAKWSDGQVKLCAEES